MRLDGARAAAARTRDPWRTQQDVTAAMRAAARHGGWRPGGGWLSQVERGMIAEVTEPVATALAAALGVGLSEILDPAEHPDIVIAALGRELAEVRAALNHIEDGLDAYLGLLRAREATHVAG